MLIRCKQLNFGSEFQICNSWEDAPPLFLLFFGFTELVPALLWIFEWLFL
jgi:hypothetical protein